VVAACSVDLFSAGVLDLDPDLEPECDPEADEAADAAELAGLTAGTGVLVGDCDADTTWGATTAVAVTVVTTVALGTGSAAVVVDVFVIDAGGIDCTPCLLSLAAAISRTAWAWPQTR
jgi:hypothetical protein